MKLHKILYPLGWAIMKLIFFFKIEGKEKIKVGDRYIVCGNHISCVDPIFVSLAVGPKYTVRYMAKQELFEANKFFGKFLKAFGAFPINRNSGLEGIKTAKDIVDAGQILGVFPEGTRSKNGELGKAKSGISMLAASTQSDIQPIAIVTKNQKVRPFRRVRIVICDVIPKEELTISEETRRTDLRRITNVIMAPIAEVLNNKK